MPEAAFARRLLDWFAAARRPLPWRERYEPYSVWISEIMLQQTQMERGVAYYRRWMQRFPDIQSVADADEDAVLAAWEGLGYYSRARNLHAAAKELASRHGGDFPRDPAAILALPGVGDYTAGAIASIAFNLPVPAVDANVLRIYSRLLDIDQPVADKAVRARVADAVRALLPHGEPRLLNQALMELGALVCTKTPRCDACPVADACRARANGTVAERPAGRTKKEYTLIEAVAGILRCGDAVLVRKRPPGGLWPGLWEFPGGHGQPEDLPHLFYRETGILVAAWRAAGTVRHGYTTHKVTLRGFTATLDGPPPAPDNGCEWAPVAELPGRAFASGHRKLLERLGWK